MNDQISDKDKKDWQTFISGKEKIVDKDFKPQTKNHLKVRSLDLHGYNRVEAEKTLKVFINTCINQEKRCILIVTGKRNTTLGAKSILRELVPSWLDSEMLASLVLAHNYAIKKDGGDGARYVLLRKKRLLNE